MQPRARNTRQYQPDPGLPYPNPIAQLYRNRWAWSFHRYWSRHSRALGLCGIYRECGTPRWLSASPKLCEPHLSLSWVDPGTIYQTSPCTQSIRWSNKSFENLQRSRRFRWCSGGQVSSKNLFLEGKLVALFEKNFISRSSSQLWPSWGQSTWNTWRPHQTHLNVMKNKSVTCA